MRLPILIVMPMLLAACGATEDVSEGTADALAAGIYAAEEKGGMCVAESGDAALIVYGGSDANCMAEGRVEGEGDALKFLPRGDTQCQIPLRREGDTIVIGNAPAACDYYCGGNVQLGGRSLTKSDRSEPLSDFAGDDLC